MQPSCKGGRTRAEARGARRADRRAPTADPPTTKKTRTNLLPSPPPLPPLSQSELGDVVYVELPEVGSEVAAGETYGVVESVKAASDVYSPVTGEVVEVNEALVDDPSKVNSDPFAGGWMMKVKVTDGGASTGGLMDAAAYKAHVDAAH